MKIGLWIFLLLILSACWPKSVSFVDVGSIPPEWKTFSVNTFELNAPNAPMSYAVTLSENIKDGIQNNTRLILDTKAGKGEVIVEGVITEFGPPVPTAIQGNDKASLNRLNISAKITIFINAPKEDQMVFTVKRYVDFPADADYSSEENKLIEEINAQIVQDVINKLLSNW
jgi:hypothetical protein